MLEDDEEIVKDIDVITVGAKVVDMFKIVGIDDSIKIVGNDVELVGDGDFRIVGEDVEILKPTVGGVVIKMVDEAVIDGVAKIVGKDVEVEMFKIVGDCDIKAAGRSGHIQASFKLVGEVDRALLK